MPIYHFNVYDGVAALDTEGTELPDMVFARREAIRYAGALLEDSAAKVDYGKDWRMEVTNATGLILFCLDFHISEAAAVAFSGSRSLG